MKNFVAASKILISLLIISISFSGFSPKPLSSLPKRKLVKYYNDYLQKSKTHGIITPAYKVEIIKWISYKRKAHETLTLIKEKINMIEWAYKHNDNTKFNRQFIKFHADDIVLLCRETENRKLRTVLEDTMLNGLCIFTMSLDLYGGTKCKETEKCLADMKEHYKLTNAIYHFFNWEVRYRKRIHNILMGIDKEKHLEANKLQIMDFCIDEIDRLIEALSIAVDHDFYFSSLEDDYLNRMSNSLRTYITLFPDMEIRWKLKSTICWDNTQMYQQYKYSWTTGKWKESVEAMVLKWPEVKAAYLTKRFQYIESKEVKKLKLVKRSV